MLKFNEEQTEKYSQNYIGDTGFLAFRDIELFSNRNKVDLSYVLDLGCGSGRSTNYLGKFCDKINGCDIDLNALKNAEKNKSKKSSQYFENKSNTSKYPYSKYKTIFSILMFFHISSKEEMKNELRKCYNSLDIYGSLIIINGTNNLYFRNYTSVKGVGKPPKNEGDIAKIKLINIDCEVSDFYWSENFIAQIAKEIGFNHLETYMPLGNTKDEIKYSYKDEVHYPPYYYIALRKNEHK